MGLLQPAKNTSAFLKMGVMGKQGAGKTKTAGKIAIGLVRHLQKLNISYANKPVAMFDTEKGSDYLIPDFEKAGIPFSVAKRRSLADLLDVMKEAEENCSALIIDSITHPYRELIAAYLKKKSRTFLQIDDWNYIKGDYGWAQFTNLYLNSKLHIIMCGRAGDDMEQYVDENGKRQLEKIGTKMKTEAETGFEPSLLVLMELVERRERDVGVSTTKTFVNRATVVKDRWDVINGNQFDEPDFTDFLPHISRLALGGPDVGVASEHDSQHILKTEKRDWQPVQREICLDEIGDLMTLKIPGQAAADKQRKVELLYKHFNASWKEMEKVMPLIDLRAGYDSLYRELMGEPSKYAALLAPQNTTTDIDDEIPGLEAAPSTAPADVPLKDKLLAQLATLETVSDILHFALQASTMEELSIEERGEIGKAVLVRQGEIQKGPQPAGDKPEPEKTAPEKAPSNRKRAVRATEDEPQAPVAAE